MEEKINSFNVGTKRVTSAERKAEVRAKTTEEKIRDVEKLESEVEATQKKAEEA